jgi:hypothetical protein
MDVHRHLPDRDRLSVLLATILLAYALTRFVDLPDRTLTIRPAGVLLTFTLNFQTIISVLVAVLAATGMDWLVRDHPRFSGEEGDEPPPGWQARFPHWILPALTAWMIGVPLNFLRSGAEWWIVFAMGGTLMALVFVGEYIVVDVEDLRHPAATAGLTALSFALYLILAIAVRSANLRLYLLLPALVPTIGIVSLRTLYLRLGGRWAYAWATGIALLVGQIAAGLHYWPISPVRFGLALVGPSYALTALAGAYEEGRRGAGLAAEPAIMLAVLWGLAAILG